MAKTSEQPLQPNPFRTYRDPQTGLWVVIKPTPVSVTSSSADGQPQFSDSQNTTSVQSFWT
ncbi:hypothetical protein VB715_04235 [Crocosphaera sp. UHCC 0190]|uniref:hypothetical protein n=1 Tax=Crocosphaera sp. UHCC 0190 TaxID=3110246 RepID=UPI002B1F8079|nr:hypothetical protein [Crocosphaera sp. UHCC 0190]MEA5508965.1 hypothetical protein [Crocosphaera sp. UHCC 0190]